MQEEEKLQDYNMVRRSAVSETFRLAQTRATNMVEGTAKCTTDFQIFSFYFSFSCSCVFCHTRRSNNFFNYYFLILTDMLKYEVDMGDKEMQQTECCILEEFPPNPKPKVFFLQGNLFLCIWYVVASVTLF